MSSMHIDSYPLAEAKDEFSVHTAKDNATGAPFRVFEDEKPWVVGSPVSQSRLNDDEIAIQPARRTVAVADIDSLFAGYAGDFAPHEDGFAASIGNEEL